MLSLPLRFDRNASDLPSGEKSGRDSVAGLATSSRASPPVSGTVQMSPPETKAIVFPSAESEGSENGGCVAENADAAKRSAIAARRRVFMGAMITMNPYAGRLQPAGRLKAAHTHHGASGLTSPAPPRTSLDARGG